MASKKRKGAKGAAVLGAWAAPKAGRVAGKTAMKAGKAQARLARSAMSSKEPRSSRFLKYGFFALVGLAIGALVSRSGREDSSSSFTGTTGHHAPDAGSPAGRRGQTWGSGTPTGTAAQTGVGTAPGEHQRPEDENRTGAERAYSDHSSGPLIGEQHSPASPEIPVQHEEIENRIRTLIGEDPRTAEMSHVNVEVNDGVAELRGVANSEAQAVAAEELAESVDGVTEVRNMLNVVT